MYKVIHYAVQGAYSVEMLSRLLSQVEKYSLNMKSDLYTPV